MKQDALLASITLLVTQMHLPQPPCSLLHPLLLWTPPPTQTVSFPLLTYIPPSPHGYAPPPRSSSPPPTQIAPCPPPPPPPSSMGGLPMSHTSVIVNKFKGDMASASACELAHPVRCKLVYRPLNLCWCHKGCCSKSPGVKRYPWVPSCMACLPVQR